jgi:hypothetical protein
LIDFFVRDEESDITSASEKLFADGHAREQMSPGAAASDRDKLIGRRSIH